MDSDSSRNKGSTTTASTGKKMSGRERSMSAGEALTRYCGRLRRELGEQLHSVLLYGSQARGEPMDGSDIDVLIIMNEPFDYGEMLDRTSAATAEISLEYDVVISRVLFTREDYESKQTPFLMNVRREAVRL